MSHLSALSHLTAAPLWVSLIAVAALCAATLFAPDASACDVDTSGMQTLFDAQEAALRAADEAAFRAGWLPEGYAQNLVGGSGNTGASMFRQGSRKQWFLKANIAGMWSPERCGPWIIPAEVWSWKDDRAVDAVEVLLTWHASGWVIVGAGEDRAQVEALARRLSAGQPLPPPAPPEE